MHFIIIYTVEAHPVDSSRQDPYSTDKEGNPIYQPQTYEARLELARKTVTEEGIEVPVLIDEIDNPVWCTYGPAPDIAYLIGTDGTIVEKQGWYQPELMEAAVEKYLAGAPTPDATPPIIPTTAVEVTKDIEYGKGGDIPLLLDVYIPETPIASPTPAIVFIHGGGWRGGDKYPGGKIRTLAKHGFVGVSINYRLSGVAPFPAAVEDCKCAVRWLRANAEKYNVDPDRIGVWGSSAGGHLAMIVGCADEAAGLEGNGGWAEYSSRVQAVCSYWGPSDFSSLPESRVSSGSNSAEIQFLDGTIEEIPDTYVLASAVTYVTPDDPPLLLVYGELDSVVPFSQSYPSL